MPRVPGAADGIEGFRGDADESWRGGIEMKAEAFLAMVETVIERHLAPLRPILAALESAGLLAAGTMRGVGALPPVALLEPWPKTIAQYAKWMGVSVRTVRRWVEMGALEVTERTGAVTVVTEAQHRAYQGDPARGEKPDAAAARRERARVTFR